MKHARFLFATLICLFIQACTISKKTTQPTVANATGNSNAEIYAQNYGEWAVAEMKRTGIPASITLAQGMLESRYGNSELTVKSNNHFGIKCHGWKGKKTYHDDDKRGECFRVYKSAYESFKDHSNFLTGNQRYAFLFKYKSTDYKSWAYGLKKAGYATDPKYPKRLIDLIERYELYRYDKGNYKPTKTPENFSVTLTRKNGEINKVTFIIARNGDTYKSIAEQYSLMKWEIYKFNDLPKSASIMDGQKIYIEPKKSKAAKGNDYHTLQQGESMYTVAQKYAIKLDKLYEMNRLDRGTKVSPGTKLWLRKTKPETEQKNSFEFEY